MRPPDCSARESAGPRVLSTAGCGVPEVQGGACTIPVHQLSRTDVLRGARARDGGEARAEPLDHERGYPPLQRERVAPILLLALRQQ